MTKSNESNEYFKKIIDKTSKYCFSSEEVCDRLDEILMKKGLNIIERQDFITYWMPQLTSKKFATLSFMNIEDYSAIASLDINPKPDKMIRVFMLFKPIDDYEETLLKEDDKIEESREDIQQKLVIEWGALNLDNYC